MQIADSVKTIKFKENDIIVKENEIGNTFYLLEEGEAIATKNIGSKFYIYKMNNHQHKF